jgi:hypothetical protein
MATRKKTRRKKAVRKGTASKGVARRSASRAGASRASGSRASGRRKTTSTTRKSSRKGGRKASAVRPKVQRVRAAVEAKARQGLGLAREGFERIKQTTVNLVEDMKERIGGGGEVESAKPSSRADDMR